MKSNLDLGSLRRRGEPFRAFLESRLASARGKDPRFSLRAFAKRLGCDHATLSQVLRRKRPLTDRMIRLLGERLGLDPRVTEGYLSAHPRAKRTRPDRNPASWKLSLEAFEVISEWQHYAILELTRLKGFRADTRWISQALDIPPDLANAAISRLCSLRMLEMTGRRTWVDRSSRVTVDSGLLTDTARRRIDEQVHERALRAVRRSPASRRIQASWILAFRAERLAELSTLVASFHRKLSALAAQDREKDDLYQIEISAFPLTTLNTPNQEE